MTLGRWLITTALGRLENPRTAGPSVERVERGRLDAFGTAAVVAGRRLPVALRSGVHVFDEHSGQRTVTDFVEPFKEGRIG